MSKGNRHDALDYNEPILSKSLSTTRTSNGEEVSLKDLIPKIKIWLRYVLSKWVIISLFAVLGGIIGFFYAYSKKTMYTAELTFIIEGSKSAGGGYAGLASQFGISLGGGSNEGVFEGQNFLVLMKSRLMIERALLTSVKLNKEQITLAEYYIRIKKLREKWQKNQNKDLLNVRFLPGESASEFTLKQNSLIGSFHGAIIAENLIVENKDKKSTIMSMRVTSEDELFSKFFTEALADEVSKFYVASKINKSKNNLTILKLQADSVRREYNAAISGVASSIDANPHANFARQSLAVPSQRRQVDAQANQAMLVELMRNLAVSQISLREETPLIQMIDKPVLPLPSQSSNTVYGSVIGLVLGAFISISIILALKYFKDVFN